MSETQCHVLPAIAVADTFKEEKIPDNARVRFGLYFFKPRASLKYLLIFRSVELFEALRALKTDSTVRQCILDMQGQGLMVAVEFASPSPSMFNPVVWKDATAKLATKVLKQCL